MGKQKSIRNESFIDKYDKIVNRSIDEINHVRNTYKWYIGFLLTILSIAIGFFFYFYGNNAEELNKKNDEVINQFINEVKDTQKVIMDNFIVATNRGIDNTIELEFERKKITSKIEQVSKTKVDSFTNDYLDNLITTSVEPKLKIINDQVSGFDNKMELFEFYLSKVAAFNDDRISFDKLYNISRNKSNLYWNEAGQVYEAIITQYSQPQIPSIGYAQIDEGGKFDWTIEKCINEFHLHSKYNRITILAHIFSKEKYSKEDRKRIATHVLKHGISLDVVNKALKYLIKTYNISARSLEIQKVLNTLK